MTCVDICTCCDLFSVLLHEQWLQLKPGFVFEMASYSYIASPALAAGSLVYMGLDTHWPVKTNAMSG